MAERLLPPSLLNFVAGLLAGAGINLLIHLLMVSVTRRRREFGLLKVLGFTNSQVVMSVAWQATTVALVGLLVGIPLGVITGRAIWLAFAAHLGVVPVAIVPLDFVGALVGGVLIVANVIAVAPAVAARNTRPARLLRTT